MARWMSSYLHPSAVKMSHKDWLCLHCRPDLKMWIVASIKLDCDNQRAHVYFHS